MSTVPRDVVDRAAAHLRGGGIVAFPTETVYGFGADAENEQAVHRIYELKGRDFAKPLSLHIADGAMAGRYAGAWPDRARTWAERYWPGPLTIVVPAADDAPRGPLAGGTTVGLRCPDNGVTVALIRALGRAMAGTSANRSGEPAMSDPAEVREAFGGEPDVLVLDSDETPSGVASTVVEVTGDGARVLREGAVTARELGIG